MRSTIRVFIKTELKKRETNRAKQTKDATPATPTTPVEAPATAATVVSGEPQAQASATDGTAVATVAVGEAQQGQGQGQGTGSSSSYSSKPLDNAQSQSRAEDSQMQESGHADARQQEADAPADGAALTNGDNNLSAATADQIVRNFHFLRVSIDDTSSSLVFLCPRLGQDDKNRKFVPCTPFSRNVPPFANTS
jgi:hypothetical protein